MAIFFFWLVLGLFYIKLVWNVFVVIVVELRVKKKDYVIMNFHYEFLLTLILMCSAALMDAGYFSDHLAMLFSVCVLSILICYGILMVLAKIFVKKI